MNNSSKKYNIVMFGHKRIPSREGGVEVVVEELSKRMVLLGNSVTCINRKSKSKNSDHELSQYEGITIKSAFTFDKKGLAAVSSSFFATLWASLGKYDIVHIHAEGPALFSFIPKLFKKKVVVTIHGLDWKRAKWGKFASWYIKTGEKNAVKYSDEIIVLSQNVKDYFIKEYNRQTTFISNGVNIPTKREANLIKQRWNLEKDSYVLFVGRLVPEKGVHYLIEAFKGINDKKLVIVGASSDSDEYETILKNMDNNVLFTGFQQGEILEELFSNAYIYCLPSDLEGMPLSLLEAMSYGNCCITSDIKECSEVVEENGILFRKSDSSDLCNKLKMLINSPDTVAEYKRKASEYICNKYNWDNVVDSTIKLYDKIFKEGRTNI